MRAIGRWFALYMAIGFVVLIPLMSYHVIAHGLPKIILVITIPLYALLAWSSYTVFKTTSKSK